MGSMPSRKPLDPFTDTARLMVDGTNLLHALSTSPERAPAAALVGRLRGVVPPTVTIEIVFDGLPDPGLRGELIASGVMVRYSGRRSADAVLLALVAEVHDTDGAEATARILVVTDDLDLRARLRVRGARTAGAAWLMGRLDRGRLVSPSVGNPRPPRRTGASPTGADDPDDDRRGWNPGRGATAKTGNARRRPRHDRT
jgi:hypothetical protein